MKMLSKYLAMAVVSLLYYTSSALTSNSSIEGSPADAGQHQQCPTWFFWNVTSRECVCRLRAHMRCSQAQNQTWIHRIECMTYDDRTDSMVLGLCPYSDLEAEDDDYVLLPENRSKLNEAMCGRANRCGLLCSRCKPGYGPSPLSYGYPCAKCSNSYFGWLLYLCTALIPTTVFFFFIVLCQVRTTSAPMNFFVFVCQIVSVNITRYPHLPDSTIFWGIGVTLCTSWNLDFFRFLIPPFCVSENLSNLQMLSMDYIVAFYPLLLTVVMYICIQQHARGCRLLVCLWKPFAYCLAPLTSQRNWNPASSIVPIFASFLLLSSNKILSVSFTLLINEDHIYNMSTTGVIHELKDVLYYDPNLVLFGQDHLPYAVLAVFVSTIGVILPCLVLILYPTRLFQKFLNWCGIGCHAVHAFADAFNGCYKNGTNNTFDFRSFAGFYLFVRIYVLLEQNDMFLSIFHFFSIAGVFIFTLASPYKNRLFNILDGFGLMLILCITYIHEYKDTFTTIGGVYMTVYYVALVSCTVILKLNCRCSQKLKALLDRMAGVRTDTPHTESEEVVGHLPDRMVNSDEYRILNEENEQPQSSDNYSNIPTYGSIQ